MIARNGRVYLSEGQRRDGLTHSMLSQRRSDFYIVRDRDTGRALALVAGTCAGEARARTAHTLARMLGIVGNSAALRASWCRLSRPPALPTFPEGFFRSARHGLPMLPGDADWL
jgi:hypothetical protein